MVLQLPVEFAYHVTNVEARENRPAWSHLVSYPCYASYVGSLRGRSCVFFSTTLYNGGMPTKSPHPLGGKPGVEYWYVKVPLRYFNDYTIIRINEEYTSNGVKQVMLRLVSREELQQLQSNSNLNIAIMLARRYLGRDRDMQYYSIDYDPYDDPTWVNFAVCHDIPLTDPGIEWDTIEHMKCPRHKMGYY